MSLIERAVFSPSDLTQKFTKRQVNAALCALLKSGKIRRIARGIYDCPKYSELMGRTLSPDIQKVKQALVRKHKWQLDVYGDVALTYLGLSRQIVAKNIFMSSGPTTKFTLFNGTSIYFRHAPSRDLGFKYHLSPAIVQALKTLGKGHIDGRVVAKIREQIHPNMRTKILNDTKGTTPFVYKAIKQICGAY